MFIPAMPLIPPCCATPGIELQLKTTPSTTGMKAERTLELKGMMKALYPALSSGCPRAISGEWNFHPNGPVRTTGRALRSALSFVQQEVQHAAALRHRRHLPRLATHPPTSARSPQPRTLLQNCRGSLLRGDGQ